MYEYNYLHNKIYNVGAVGTVTASFGRGVGPIFMDDTRCTGNETQLIQCPSSGIGSHNCLHFEDAGAICQRKQLQSNKEIEINLTVWWAIFVTAKLRKKNLPIFFTCIW